MPGLLKWIPRGAQLLLPACVACALAACAAPVAKDEFSPLRERVAELEAKQTQLLDQEKKKRATTHHNSEDLVTRSIGVPQKASEDVAQQLARLEAEISQQLAEYNKRPRTLFPGMRAFAAERIAYEAALIKKLEHIGTQNYPEEARGRIYGSLVLSMTIGPKGNLLEVRVERSSGEKILDDAAIRVARMGEPYASLPEAILQHYERMVVVRVWSFTKGQILESQDE